jgi:hypothetical protein
MSSLAYGIARLCNAAAMAAPRVSRRAVRVIVEATPKRAFASALDWPGWCRGARDERAALDQLADHAARYAVVAQAAGLAVGVGEFSVIERVGGSATTDFGAPGTPAAAEAEPLSAAGARRLEALISAAWAVFDEVVASAPPSLRKGPRGGGRDRDAMAGHVLAAENAYARKLGVRVSEPHVGEAAAIGAQRKAILAGLRAGLRAPADSRGWLPRYAARRIAWHVLDHAWAMENRSER